MAALRDQKRLLDAALVAYRANPQVEAVFTGKDIAATALPAGQPERWSLIQRARASYFSGRSGDFVVVLKKDVTPMADTTLLSRPMAAPGITTGVFQFFSGVQERSARISTFGRHGRHHADARRRDRIANSGRRS